MSAAFWTGCGMVAAGMGLWAWALCKGFSVRDEAARSAFEQDVHQ